MLFKFAPALALLAGLALANPEANPEPQTPAQTTEAVAELSSYLIALQTDPALLSLASVFETNPGAVSTLVQFEQSLVSVVENHQTPAADFLSGLPTEAQSFFGSVYTAEASIASKNGFTSAGTSAATGTHATAAGTGASTTSGNAAPTAALGLSAGALAGFVGVVMAL